MLVEALGAAALAASLRWLWWLPKAQGIPILMYHKIGKPPENSKLKKLWVDSTSFRAQMRFLSQEGYKSITFKELQNGGGFPDKPVILTFDDGYRNNFTEAFPILKEYGFRGALFLVCETLGKKNLWHDPASEDFQEMLADEEIREMQKAGWEIGSHTLSHKNLGNLWRLGEQKEVQREIKESREILKKRFGEAPIVFSYPYGEGADEPEIQNLVKESGYAFACGIHQGKARPEREPFALRRILMRGDDTGLDFRLNLRSGRSRL